MRKTKKITAMLMVTLMLMAHMVVLLSNVVWALPESVNIDIQADVDDHCGLRFNNQEQRDYLTYQYDETTAFVFDLKKGEDSILLQFEAKETSPGSGVYQNSYYKNDIAIDSNTDLYLTCENFDSTKICVRYGGQPLAFQNGRSNNLISGEATQYSLRIEGIYPNANPEQNNQEQGEQNNNNAQDASYSVDFGEASWKVKGKTVTATINGNPPANPANIKGNTEITLSNYDPQTMDVRVTEQNGENPFSTTLSVKNGVTRIMDHNAEHLPNGPFIFSVVEHEEHVDPQQQQSIEETVYTVDFRPASWEIRGKTATAVVEGKKLTAGEVQIRGDQVIKINNFDSKLMEAVVRVVEEGKDPKDWYTPKLDVNENGETSIANVRTNGNMPNDKPLVFVVQRRTNEGPEMPELEPPNTEATFNISSSQAHSKSYVDARLAINQYVIEFPVPEEGKQVPNAVSKNVAYYYDNENGNGKVTLRFSTLFIQKYVGNITVNGHVYKVSDYLDYSDRTAWIKHYKYQEVGFNIEVDKADVYDIVIDIDENEGKDQWIGNFLWTDDPAESESDLYIGHSTLEIVRVTYEMDGKEYTVEEKDLADDPYIEYFPYGSVGSMVVPEGASCTMRITPDYGYQVTSFGMNGRDIITGDAVSEFTFPIHKGNFHLNAEVTKVDDIVDAKSGKVKEGTIVIGKNEIDSGTVVLSVNDAELNSNKIAGFEKAAGEYTIKNYLDIDLDKVVYKGTSENVWSERIHELRSPATITLKLEDGIDANNIVIVHNINDGEEYEIIEIESYDPTTNTITFRTSSFSNYAIATKGEGNGLPKEKYTVQTGDFTLTFLDDAGHTFEVSVLAVWSLSDDELVKYEISKEEYEKAKKEVIEKTKKYGTVLDVYQIDVADNDFEHTGEVTIRFKMTEEMKKYNTFKLVCIDEDKIGDKDVIELSIDGDYLVGTLHHLSNYALMGSVTTAKNVATGDNIMLFISMFGAATFGMLATRKMKKNNRSRHF